MYAGAMYKYNEPRDFSTTQYSISKKEFEPANSYRQLPMY
jgi:hypothetical protein